MKAPSIPLHGVVAVAAVRAVPVEMHHHSVQEVVARVDNPQSQGLHKHSQVEVAVRVDAVMPHVRVSAQPADSAVQVVAVLAVATALTAKFPQEMVQQIREAAVAVAPFVMAPTTPAATVGAAL